jgi:hypothetical protein
MIINISFIWLAKGMEIFLDRTLWILSKLLTSAKINFDRYHSVNKMLFFFQNNVVPEFFNGMVCWHYHLQWICGYVHVYKIIKQLFHVCSGNSQNYCPSDYDTFIRCNPVWTRQDFVIVINIHEIVLTNHRKGQR